MFGSKEFTGIVLEGGTLKVAQVAVVGKKLQLIKLDQFSLVEPIDTTPKKEQAFDDEEDFGKELDADSIFGLEDDTPPALDDALTESDDEEEFSFDDLAAESGEDDLMALDMVEEAGSPQSNDILLYNILSGIDPNKLNLGFNIPAGSTIFQVIKDTNFKEVKTKDLIADLEEKLESLYGVSKSKDNYAYDVREEDGSLLLASVDDESPLLHLLNQTLEHFSGKITVEEVLSDEVILAGLVKANYVFPDYEITGVIQFGPDKCRIVFLKGNEILQVSPIINEGTKNKSFLNTVFSKILFQLDTGEIPNLDRIIIANNTLGDEAISFFKKNFSDIAVSEFEYDEEKISFDGLDQKIVSSFTTAIGIAWAASGVNKKEFPKLSLLPAYVKDRQKMFKLQWHGILMLLLIFISPITINYFYQQNSDKLTKLNSDLEYVNLQIAQIEPVVESTNQLSSDLSLLREKLVLLDTLSKGSREWSTKLDILNEGLRNIGSTWLTSMRQTDNGVFLDGYTLYRDRVPRVVDIFEEATLLNVSIQEEREQEIFRFSMLVKEFAKDRAEYSPVVPEELKEIIIN